MTMMCCEHTCGSILLTYIHEYTQRAISINDDDEKSNRMVFHKRIVVAKAIPSPSSPTINININSNEFSTLANASIDAFDCGTHKLQNQQKYVLLYETEYISHFIKMRPR